jgi:hypothetical protein
MNRDREFGSSHKSLANSGYTQNLMMFLLFSLCPLLTYQLAFQNDTYWLINTGKYILNNGLPSTEPFTIHQGLHFMAQQWLTTIVFHVGYQKAGVAGVHLIVIGICSILLFVIYRLAFHLSAGKKMVAAYVTVFIGIFIGPFIVPRPQIFSLLLFVLEISILEYHVRSKKKPLAVTGALALLSVALINFHAAMWPVFFVLFIPYIIDSFKFQLGRIEGQGYPKKPLWAALILSLICGFANPYGLQGMLYFFNSYGDSVINGNVVEMLSPDFKSTLGIFVFAVALAVFFTYMVRRGTTRLRFVLITIGTLYMGFSSWRSFSLFVVFGFVFLSYYLKDMDLSHAMPARRRTILLIFAFPLVLAGRISNIKNMDAAEIRHKPVAAVGYILKSVDLSKIRLYNSYETGGYIEFSGIKTFIDSRAEVFTKKLNGKEDIFKDYVEASTGKQYYADLIKKYAFTHFLVGREESWNNFLKHDRRYRAIYQDKNYIVYESVP